MHLVDDFDRFCGIFMNLRVLFRHVFVFVVSIGCFVWGRTIQRSRKRALELTQGWALKMALEYFRMLYKICHTKYCIYRKKVHVYLLFFSGECFAQDAKHKEVWHAKHQEGVWLCLEISLHTSHPRDPESTWVASGGS